MQANRKPVAKVYPDAVFVFYSYPIKDSLKKRGFKFDHDSRAWYYKPQSYEELVEIVKFLGELGVEVPEVGIVGKLERFYQQLRELHQYYIKEIYPELRRELEQLEQQLRERGNDVDYPVRYLLEDEKCKSDTSLQGYTALGRKNMLSGFLSYLSYAKLMLEQYKH